MSSRGLKKSSSRPGSARASAPLKKGKRGGKSSGVRSGPKSARGNKKPKATAKTSVDGSRSELVQSAEEVGDASAESPVVAGALSKGDARDPDASDREDLNGDIAEEVESKPRPKPSSVPLLDLPKSDMSDSRRPSPAPSGRKSARRKELKQSDSSGRLPKSSSSRRLKDKSETMSEYSDTTSLAESSTAPLKDHHKALTEQLRAERAAKAEQRSHGVAKAKAARANDWRYRYHWQGSGESDATTSTTPKRSAHSRNQSRTYSEQAMSTQLNTAIIAQQMEASTESLKTTGSGGSGSAQSSGLLAAGRDRSQTAVARDVVFNWSNNQTYFKMDVMQRLNRGMGYMGPEGEGYWIVNRVVFRDLAMLDYLENQVLSYSARCNNYRYCALMFFPCAIICPCMFCPSIPVDPIEILEHSMPPSTAAQLYKQRSRKHARSDLVWRMTVKCSGVEESPEKRTKQEDNELLAVSINGKVLIELQGFPSYSYYIDSQYLEQLRVEAQIAGPQVDQVFMQLDLHELENKDKEYRRSRAKSRSRRNSTAGTTSLTGSTAGSRRGSLALKAQTTGDIPVVAESTE